MARKHLGCDFTDAVTLAFEAEGLEVVGQAKCDQPLVEPGFHKASAYRGGRLKTSSATLVSMRRTTPGDESDLTRSPAFYNSTYECFTSLGWPKCDRCGLPSVVAALESGMKRVPY